MIRPSVFFGWCLAGVVVWTIGTAQPSYAEVRSFYSPIVYVDREKGFIVISNSGAVFGIEVPPEAKPHLEKLPVSGMIDVVVEIRPNQVPLIKTWKIAAGETSCRIFDGKVCR